MKYAVLSVYDKTGIQELASALIECGYTILSSGGTAKILESSKIPATLISEYTEFPELLEGRVKTLHPKIHAGILARKGVQADREQLKQQDIPLIDLVTVNLYPFQDGLSKKLPPQEMTELIDIGGVTLLRAAAKNFERVTTLFAPEDYPEIIRQLKENGRVDQKTRTQLAAKAFELTAEYDREIAGWMNKKQPSLLISGQLKQQLRYGENPQQQATFYVTGEKDGTSLARARQLGGKELSYNNIIDIEGALSLALEFEKTTAVVVKHTNPCGCAQGNTPALAFQRALATDPKSAYGGIIALNREIDLETAQAIAGIFVEAVIAPKFSQDALLRLGRKKNLRLLETGLFQPRPPHNSLCSVYGGVLVQQADGIDWDFNQLKTVAGPEPDPQLQEELLFAWRICKHVKSNAIVLARDLMAIGIGAGQMSRIDAAELAWKKAGDAGLSPQDGILASDAFFPFPDVVELAAQAGIRAIIQPGGSIRDQESIDCAQAHGITMVFTGIRHFRH